MLILNQDDGLVYDFNEAHGRIEGSPRALVPGVLIRGATGTIDERLIAFYRGSGNKLFLNERGHIVEVPDEAVVEMLALPGGIRRIIIEAGGRTIWSLQYRPHEEKIPGDPTPAPDEDFDFGLFIANVLRNPGRRRRIFMMPV